MNLSFFLVLQTILLALVGAHPVQDVKRQISSLSSSSSDYWLANIQHRGVVPFGNSTSYQVFRNVKDFGAKGDGFTDDTDAINAAISSGNRCGLGCGSSTVTPALVYIPPGTYLVSKPIIAYYYTQIIGDPLNRPVIKGSPAFSGMALIDSDPYTDEGVNWYVNQNNFFRSIRHIIIDLTAMPLSTGAGIHWQVGQATDLRNIQFEMIKGGGKANKQQGIFMDNGSGGFMADLVFNGGNYGMFVGNQQFTTRNLVFNDCNTAIYMNWNWGWTLKSVTINNCTTGLDMSNSPQNQSVGSVLLLDSKFTRTATGIISAWSGSSIPPAAGTLIIDNVDFSGASIAVAGVDGSTILPGGSVVPNWVQGDTYTPSNHLVKKDSPPSEVTRTVTVTVEVCPIASHDKVTSSLVSYPPASASLAPAVTLVPFTGQPIESVTASTVSVLPSVTLSAAASSSATLAFTYQSSLSTVSLAPSASVILPPLATPVGTGDDQSFESVTVPTAPVLPPVTLSAAASSSATLAFTYQSSLSIVSLTPSASVILPPLATPVGTGDDQSFESVTVPTAPVLPPVTLSAAASSSATLVSIYQSSLSTVSLTPSASVILPPLATPVGTGNGQSRSSASTLPTQSAPRAPLRASSILSSQEFPAPSSPAPTPVPSLTSSVSSPERSTCGRRIITGARTQAALPSQAKPSSLIDQTGMIFERAKPSYGQYSASSFISVRASGAKGDGVTDDTEAIQSVFDSAKENQVVYFDHGAYLITSTIKVPKNIKITGEVWPMLMAHGEKFSDQNNPIPMLQIGEPGDVGSVEISDLLLETNGPAPGAILMEWNLAEESQGSTGMWDVHTRVGGSASSGMQSDRCAKTPFVETIPSPECIGAFLLFHATKDSTPYVENAWFWTADHELDLPDHSQINIYTGRGVLIESSGPAWLYGTSSEHNQLYNYQVNDARDIFMGFIQTETPYYQDNPNALVPFTPQAKWSDPDFQSCTSEPCRKSWGLRVLNTSDLYIYGAGLYSFFENYSQTCIESGSCQENMVEVDCSNVHIYGLSTIASVNMITSTDGTGLVLGDDNKSTYCSTVALFEQ